MSAPAVPPATAVADGDLLAAGRALVARARFRERGVLLESEAMALLELAGLTVPRRIEVAGADGLTALPDPPLPVGERAVLKALGPDLLHKTELGAVRVVPNRRDAVAAAAREMEWRLVSQGLGAGALAGFLLYEFVPHERALGHELLLGLRWTRDFGPVVTLGPGGVHAELLARAFRPGEGLAVLSPSLADEATVARALERLVPVRLVTTPQRGQPPLLAPETLSAAVRRFLALAAALCPDAIAELEANPVVVSGGRLVALDALCKLSAGEARRAAAPRPLAKIDRLLRPRTIAVVGVSEKLNPGRIILQNVLREGFPPEQVTVVKPGSQTIEGCRCVPSLADLPAPVDLAVLSVSAAQAAGMLIEIAERNRAESVVLIPGGLEEKPGAEALVARMRAALAVARASEGGGPVVNGGNCLGIRSVPGRYNTLFIPEHKLPVPRGEAHPVALVTGSGAFAVSKGNKLAGVNPRYTITIGNQMDLTAADYLHYLADDPALELFAVYLEGFRPLDGARFLEAARAITASGRTVVLYRGGRTQAGAAAAASHTAAVAGDYLVTRELAEAAGCLVAETLDDFEDLVRLFVFLRDRTPRGLRLGALSNAGFECVAMADRLGPFALADYADSTRERLAAILAEARLSEIVSPGNPMDLTPILGDAGYEAVVRAVLADPGVDAAVVGVVPMTGALVTLEAGPGHGEDLQSEDGIVARLARLRREADKPWVAVVDGGRIYDALARAIEDAGIPCFRVADRALRLFGVWCRTRLRPR